MLEDLNWVHILIASVSFVVFTLGFYLYLKFTKKTDPTTYKTLYTTIFEKLDNPESWDFHLDPNGNHCLQTTEKDLAIFPFGKINIQLNFTGKWFIEDKNLSEEQILALVEKAKITLCKTKALYL